jgi:hypothetical protein
MATSSFHIGANRIVCNATSTYSNSGHRPTSDPKTHGWTDFYKCFRNQASFVNKHDGGGQPPQVLALKLEVCKFVGLFSSLQRGPRTQIPALDWRKISDLAGILPLSMFCVRNGWCRQRPCYHSDPLVSIRQNALAFPSFYVRRARYRFI